MEIVEKIQMYKHLPSGEVFSSMHEVNVYDVRYKANLNRIEQKEKEKREIKRKIKIIEQKLKETTRLLTIAVNAENKYKLDKKSFIVSHPDVNKVINEINNQETLIKKHQLAIKLLSRSLIHQRSAALKEFKKKNPPKSEVSRLRTKKRILNHEYGNLIRLI